VTALLYFVIAAAAASLASRAFLSDRTDPGRQAFLALGWSVAISYGAFSLSLLPGLASLRAVYMLVGCFVPAAGLWCIDRALPLRVGPPARSVALLFIATALVAPTSTAVHLMFYAHYPRSSPAEVFAGLFVFLGFGFVLYRLYEAYSATALRVERTRLSYLLAIAASAVVFSLIEQLARNLAAPVDPGTLTLTSRGVVLQGAVPPVSAILTALALYLLYHTVMMARLLDIQEVFSKLAALLISALMLVLVDALTFLWADTLATYPLHWVFQIFLASLLFLAAYEPSRDQIAWFANRSFNSRGQQLAETLHQLRSELPTTASTSDLSYRLLDGLHASGRVPVGSLYLWDAKSDAFTCVGHHGHDERPPLRAVAVHPFTDGFLTGAPWYTRPAMSRRARGDAKAGEILSLMDAMGADLTLPFTSSTGIVLGWLHLRDENWSDGYSAAEIQSLQELVGLGSVVLSNIADFRAREEEQRLASLGAMAAGLAHEIRNPLAGVKGAAQYLQHESLDEEAGEMLQVIVHEVDRLDTVVTQFLDYARPFELDLKPEDLEAILKHSLAVLRAQGIPDNVELHEELSPSLPALPLDAARISQVLLNLLQNALQAMPGGGTLRVITRRRYDVVGNPVVEVAIADTGAGIAPTDLDQIFVPFFTTKSGGTGLGLAICQRIVQAHGGEIDVQSDVGVGSTFIVRLPRPSGAATQDQAG